MMHAMHNYIHVGVVSVQGGAREPPVGPRAPQFSELTGVKGRPLGPGCGNRAHFCPTLVTAQAHPLPQPEEGEWSVEGRES